MKLFSKFIGVSLLAVLAIGFVSCVEDDALEIQKPYTYDSQYFKNILEFKSSEHCLSYAYYAAYAPIEGVEGYKDPASWGERLRGLPDSLDICNLWMGIPSNDPTADNYMPVAYEDMRYVQSTLGTRFVSHADASQSSRTVEGVTFDFTENTESTIQAYGQALVDQALKYDLDGIDVDYEPNWSGWRETSNILLLAETIGKTFGPKGTMPEKLFIIDFYSDGSRLNAEVGQYVDYFVIQAYTQGFSEHSDSRLQNTYYGQISDWCEPGKVIVCENFGTWYADGGSPYVDDNGDPVYTTDGSRMYSLEGMARWNPTQGTKGGFGAFYMDRDYFSSTGIPYYNFRRCIQIANPSIY
ncbi:MAG: glycoside hydrolase family 18 [Bacteroidales bacterium]|nr:glycoside hydrolase family 18 [Bacteroidales bacterium]